MSDLKIQKLWVSTAYVTVTEASKEDNNPQGKGESEKRVLSSARALRNYKRKRNLQRRGQRACWKKFQEYCVTGQ